MRRTLILDANYQPVAIVSWQKALCYVLLEKAVVIEEYADFVVRSISKTFNVPKILRVLNSAKVKDKRISLTSHNIYKRDNYTCAYCLTTMIKGELTIDHIVPLCQGGRNTWENLITACTDCNGKKGGKTPEQANMPLKFKPYQPKWTPKNALTYKPEEFSFWKEWLIY